MTPPSRQVLYIQMEFCPRTLAAVLEAGPLEEADAWGMLRGMLTGLAYVHSQVREGEVVCERVRRARTKSERQWEGDQRPGGEQGRGTWIESKGRVRGAAPPCKKATMQWGCLV